MTSTSAFGGRTPAGSSGRLLPSGETAVLAEVADLDAALALYRRLDSTRPPGVVGGAQLVGGGSGTYSVESRARLEDGRIAVLRAVLRAGAGPVPGSVYTALRWQEGTALQ